MIQTDLHLSRQFTIGAISPLIFGGFLEHMGRSIYEGVYDPDSAHADDDGMRKDVLTALANLGLTIVRYPGGNFASGYHWQDGVGPREQRPTVRDLAWQSIETNEFGTDEFLKLCRKLDWQPMLAVNLGTGTPEEARNWVEYCNAALGTVYADQREANEHPEPYGVRYWCLGNEMDGPWQLGHGSAQQYGSMARQAAKMMKDLDRKLETVVCGSSAPAMPTYLEWDQSVLETVGGLGDYISLHRYVGNSNQDTADYLALSNSIDQQIESVDACCRFVQAKRKSRKRQYLCFDEWNVWYKARSPEDMDGRGQKAPHLVEEVYNLEDALVVAGFLMSFIRHADSVKIANLAQLVNVIAPILTRGDECLLQSIYHAFRLFSTRKGGVSLRPSVAGPGYESASYGFVNYLDCAASLDSDTSTLHLFLTNRHSAEVMPLKVCHDLGVKSLTSGEILTANDAKAANSFDEPNAVAACPFDAVTIRDNELVTELPPLSLVALSFAVS